MVQAHKRRNADRLKELIAEVDDNSNVCSLISNYMGAAQRQVRYFHKRYPHEDVEPTIMQALYLAAFTFDGRGSFYYWFRYKIFGQTSRFRLAAKHREIGYLRAGRPSAKKVREWIRPLKRVAYSEQLVDGRLSYSFQEPTWE